jgi:hypothetical protein
MRKGFTTTEPIAPAADLRRLDALLDEVARCADACRDLGPAELGQVGDEDLAALKYQAEMFRDVLRTNMPGGGLL